MAQRVSLLPTQSTLRLEVAEFKLRPQLGQRDLRLSENL